MKLLPAIKRILLKPAVIMGELAGLALAGSLGAVFPDAHVFGSGWFALVALLTALSLAVVVGEQFRRVRRQWRLPLTVAQFQSAPFKMEFDRPATAAAPGPKIWSERQLGLAGSLVFHTGLLLLIIAGAARALFAADAAVDLIEGETLTPATAWSVQWPGVLAKPLRLDQPVTLESVSGSRYADGNLRALNARLSAGDIAVNHQLRFAGGRLYLSQDFGPAALLEWPAGRREAVLLTKDGSAGYLAAVREPDDVQLFLRANTERPGSLNLRAMRGDILLTAATLRINEPLALPGGQTLALRAAPMWVRLHGSRDAALWLAYLGMVLTMAGAALMFCLVRLDFCVCVFPAGERERVFVALRPQRFAPLFQERFEQLVREQAELVATPYDEFETPKTFVLPPVRRGVLASRLFLVLFGLLLGLALGCHRVSTTRARALVERYNQAVADAYRRGDVRLADPVVGPKEGRKLAGLIGVRLDLGITLDSQLLTLQITRVEQQGDVLRVGTTEHWRYRDLQIGTGKQVGDASRDAYAMTYIFTNVNQTWLVDEIQFAAPPQVGRTNTPWIADRGDLPGARTKETKP